MRLSFDKIARGCLFSKLQVDARLMTRVASVKKEMGAYPALNLVREGTSLFYEIRCDEKDDHFYSLELGKASVSLTIYSRQNPTFFMQEATLRLLGILQILSGSYEVKIGSLYPYLILALADQQLTRLAREEIRKEDTEPELILARKIISLMKENVILKEDYRKTHEKLRRVVLEAMAISGSVKDSAEEVAATLKIDKNDVLAALALAREAGYRVMHTGNSGFSLVRV